MEIENGEIKIIEKNQQRLDKIDNLVEMCREAWASHDLERYLICTGELERMGWVGSDLDKMLKKTRPFTEFCEGLQQAKHNVLMSICEIFRILTAVKWLDKWLYRWLSKINKKP